MQKSEKQLECHPALLLLEVEESTFDQLDRISIVDDHQIPQHIFIYKDKENSEFEVRIYKFSPTDTYMSTSLNFHFKKYVANDKFASFYFGTFSSACLFIEQLAKAHPESLIRPVLESKKD